MPGPSRSRLIRIYPRQGSARAWGSLLGLVAVVWAGSLALATRSAGAQEGPTDLSVDSSLQTKLLTLAGALHREIALCLLGDSSDDTARVGEFVMPVPRRSTASGSSFATCPPETLALWHNHPLTFEEPDTDPRPTPAIRHEPVTNPLVVCALSRDDIETIVRLGFPFAVVAVDQETWCWWTLDQVRGFQRRRLIPGPRIPGQTERRPRQPVVIDNQSR